MTTTTQPRTVTTDTVETQTASTAIATGRPSGGWLQRLKDRRSTRSDLARAIAAYPASRSAAAVVLPAHLGGSRWSDAVG